MPAWTITRTDTAAQLRAGNAPTAPAAWGQAAAAVLDELEHPEGALAEWAVTVGVAHALIVAGRTAADELDLPGTRAAVERMVLAAVGHQILDELLRAP